MKPMTNEEMADRLEKHAAYWNDTDQGGDDPKVGAELEAIARRIRLLGAVAIAERRWFKSCIGETIGETNEQAFDKVEAARAALDADERGEVKDGN